MRAVVLLSGGLDSYTAAAIAKADRFSLFALTVRLRAAPRARGRVGACRGARARRRAPPRARRRICGRSAARRSPRARPFRTIATSTPPGFRRRTCRRGTRFFLSLALGWAEVLGARDIVIGVNALDYSGYPDCRPEFIAAFEHLANLATRAGVEGGRFRVHTPLIALGKADIVRRGLELGLDYGLTHSCYDPAPDGRPCGTCDSCVLRAKGFREAGVPDPVLMG